MANTYGRQVVVALTNKSGGSVAAGDVVIMDVANNDAFTTTTGANATITIGIAQDTIASNASGRVLLSGYASLINVNASVTRGNYGATYTVAKQATDVGATRQTGTFVQFLSSGATPDGAVFPVSSGTASPLTTKGDLWGYSTTDARIAIGTNGYVLTADSTQTLGVKWAVGTGGGGSATTIGRPSLTPVSPTDDFTATLSGWTAASTFGSFTTTTVLSQALDGSHLFLPYYGQSGFIYKSASNVDQEWIAGGVMTVMRPTTNDQFYGIALLDSSNNGMGVIYHQGDDTCALIQIAAGIFDGSHATTTTNNWGKFIGSPVKLWFRLTRVTNTWRGYVSMDGVNWNDSTSTLNDTITVSRKAVGAFGISAASYIGQMYVDWVNTV